MSTLTTTADTPTLADMEEKYRDLVWYARKDETLRAANLQVAEQCAQVEHKCPVDTITSNVYEFTQLCTVRLNQHKHL